MSWEYFVFTTAHAWSEELNELGWVRWQLVSVVYADCMYRFYFKREV